MAEALRDRGHEVMLFVSEKEIDTLALSGRQQFQFEKLPTIGLPSLYSPAILGFARRFHQSISLCRAIYRRFQPHVVLGMGGFTSTAPVMAGRMRGVATFIHESNAIPGKANRMTARFVRAVLLGFKECAPFFPRVRTEVTGTPIRSDLVRLDKNVAREKLGLRQNIATVLVMGGSQGATGINQGVIKALPFLHQHPVQMLHLTGKRDERLVRDSYQKENIPAFVAAFHHRMEELYSAADFAIARSGAASLAEIAAFALPAILIPYPYAAEDHQTRNAEIFVRAGAAILVKEAGLSGESLARHIADLIGNDATLKRMAENSLSLGRKDAAAEVAATVERISANEHGA